MNHHNLLLIIIFIEFNRIYNIYKIRNNYAIEEKRTSKAKRQQVYCVSLRPNQNNKKKKKIVKIKMEQ